MPKVLSNEQVAAYARDGTVFPVRVMSVAEAGGLRRRLEAAEAEQGGPFTGPIRHKPHLLYTWLDALVRAPLLLDAVEDLIGPNILCWASSFFIKEAQDPAYVSWHQDSTYWGLSEPEEVTAWVALTPSSPENGCMRVIPGTHTKEQQPHTDTHAEHNILTRGQVVDCEVDESEAVDLVLEPGEMSLHHVRLIHGSEANTSDARRTGFAIRYIPPHLRQVNGPRDCAMLVRGEDRYGHFEHEPGPAADLDPQAVAWHRKVTELHGQLLYRDTERRPYT